MIDVKAFHQLVNGLTAKNLEMKSKVAMVEVENTEFKKGFSQLEVALKELKRTLEELIS